nr:hypothetical protein [uncultured Albidiferax sp.]
MAYIVYEKFGSNVDKYDFDKYVTSGLSRLRSCFDDIHLTVDFNFDEFCADLVFCVENNTANDGFLGYSNMESIKSEGETYILDSFRLTFLFFNAAIKERESDPGKAWKLVVEAYFYLGNVIQIADNKFIISKFAERKKRSIVAGKKKNENSDLAKKELSKLLISCCPEKGWKSVDKAVVLLESKLFAALQKEKIPMDGASVGSRIKNWLSSDGDLKTIFRSLKKID